MLEKLLKNKNCKIVVFIFILVNSVLFINCSVYETLLLPSSAEETMLMRSLEVLSEGSGSLANNPAGCGMENKKSFSLSYTYWRLKENLYSLGLFLPKNFANLGFKLRYADLGETEFVLEEPINVRKENLYFIIFNTSLGKEIFFPGFFLGIDLGLGSIKLNRNLNLLSSKLGVGYILNFTSTELHLGCSVGITFCDSESLGVYGLGIKYFITEYKTFFNISYTKNVYSFITLGLECELWQNFVLISGYEISNEKSLINYSIGGKIIQKNFDIILATRYNQELNWTTSVSVGIKW